MIFSVNSPSESIQGNKERKILKHHLSFLAALRSTYSSRKRFAISRVAMAVNEGKVHRCSWALGILSGTDSEYTQTYWCPTHRCGSPKWEGKRGQKVIQTSRMRPWILGKTLPRLVAPRGFQETRQGEGTRPPDLRQLIAKSLEISAGVTKACRPEGERRIMHREGILGLRTVPWDVQQSYYELL